MLTPLFNCDDPYHPIALYPKNLGSGDEGKGWRNTAIYDIISVKWILYVIFSFAYAHSQFYYDRCAVMIKYNIF